MAKAIIFDCFGVLTLTRWSPKWPGRFRPNNELFNFIKDELKPNYRIGMLSNADKNWLERLFSDDQIQLFDAVALSCEIGVAKPELKAYTIASEKLGVEPAECIFIDDIARFCSAAEEAGMQAILFKNNEQLWTELRDKLSVQ